MSTDAVFVIIVVSEELKNFIDPLRLYFLDVTLSH